MLLNHHDLRLKTQKVQPIEKKTPIYILSMASKCSEHKNVPNFPKALFTVVVSIKKKKNCKQKLSETNVIDFSVLFTRHNTCSAGRFQLIVFCFFFAENSTITNCELKNNFDEANKVLNFPLTDQMLQKVCNTQIFYAFE